MVDHARRRKVGAKKTLSCEDTEDIKVEFCAVGIFLIVKSASDLLLLRGS
jgi:hypothetical protein